MDYLNISKELLEKLGGKENIAAAAHCATRLRLTLNDDDIVDFSELEKIEGVKAVFQVAGQTQLIFGSGTVNMVYKEFAGLIGQTEMSSSSDVAKAGAKKQNLLQRLVKGLSDIFVPIIPAIVAGGLMMGLYNILVAPGLIVDDISLIEAYPHMGDIANMLNTFANAPFVFLPILIAFSATQKFGGNPYLGAALGMLMVHPDLLNGWGFGSASIEGDIPVWNILGLEVQKVGYQGSVLPVLVCSFILAKTELGLRRIVPQVLDNLLTPLLAILITGFLTFSFVGPLTRDAGFLIGDGLTWLYETAGALGGGIFGFFYAPIVITGMHHSFIAIETQLLANFATTGGSFIFPIAAMSNVAQGAAALAVGFLAGSKKVKGVATPSGITALLGITEPAMFGVNLKYRYPFYAAICGAAAGGVVISLGHVKAQALGAAGLPGIISIVPQGVPMYIVGMAVSFLTAFILTFVMKAKFIQEIK